MQRTWQGLVGVVALTLVVSPAALARETDAGTLMTECGAADLPVSAIDSCLERVRVAEETNPSPQLPSLEAQLEERKSGKPTRAAAGKSPPSATGSPRDLDDDHSKPTMFDNSIEVPSRPVMGEVSEDAPPPDRDLESPGAGQGNIDRNGTVSDTAPRDVPDFGSSKPESGADTDDEPPIADPPDGPPPAGDPQ